MWRSISWALGLLGRSLYPLPNPAPTAGLTAALLTFLRLEQAPCFSDVFQQYKPHEAGKYEVLHPHVQEVGRYEPYRTRWVGMNRTARYGPTRTGDGPREAGGRGLREVCVSRRCDRACACARAWAQARRAVTGVGSGVTCTESDET